MGREERCVALAQGKGILFCTGHFGYWEQQAIAHALKFEPMAVMARPLDNPRLHDLLERIRASNGNSVIYRRGAVRRRCVCSMTARASAFSSIIT
jgi:KDO2-lipid IV(A) lauroyltransferase